MTCDQCGKELRRDHILLKYLPCECELRDQLQTIAEHLDMMEKMVENHRNKNWH